MDEWIFHVLWTIEMDILKFDKHKLSNFALIINFVISFVWYFAWKFFVIKYLREEENAQFLCADEGQSAFWKFIILECTNHRVIYFCHIHSKLYINYFKFLFALFRQNFQTNIERKNILHPIKIWKTFIERIARIF